MCEWKTFEGVLKGLIFEFFWKKYNNKRWDNTVYKK